MRVWLGLMLLWGAQVWAQTVEPRSVTGDVAAIRATVADYTEGELLLQLSRAGG